MVQYLDNTIYTNYALNKICENLVDNISNFYFIKVQVGSGDNTLDVNRQSLSALLYSLNVIAIEYNDGIITIKCEIPPELADVPITEIALIDTVMGFDHLFSYSKVNVVKPSDLGYELTIVLNLGPRTIDFPGINEYYIPRYSYVTQGLLDDFVNMFLYVDTNLERIVRSNAGVIGSNIPEKVYERQLGLERNLKNIDYSLLYYSLHSYFGTDLSDLFFLGAPNYLAYDIINYTDNNSVLTTKYKLWDSTSDHVTFNEGPLSLFFVNQLDNSKVESTIFNKVDQNGVYFSVNVEKNEEEYITTTEGVERTEFYEMVFTIYGNHGSYKMKYIFDEDNMGQYLGQKIPYVITFNGDLTTSPEFHFYINGVEPETFVLDDTVQPSIDVQAGVLPEDSEETKNRKRENTISKLKTCAFGKMIYSGELSYLINLPDSSTVPLKNYMYNYNEQRKDSYIHALGTSIIGTLKRQVNEHELALLNNTLKMID